MKNRMRLAVLLGVFFSTAVCLAKSELLTVDDKRVPKKISEACGSVVVFAYEFDEPLLYDRKEFKKLEDGVAHTNLQKALLKKSREECDANKLEKCAWKYSNFGSAFFVEDRDLLMTGFHNLPPHFSALREKYRELPQKSPTTSMAVINEYAPKMNRLKFSLFDQFGNEIFSPEQGDSASFHSGAVPESLSRSFALFDSYYEMLKLIEEPSDYVKVRLSRKIPNAIPIPQSKLVTQAAETKFPLDSTGATLYGCGLFDGGNAKGKSLIVVGEGKIALRFPQTLKEVKDEEKWLVEFGEMFSLTVVGAAGPGMSGGPILNPEGELVSILTATYSNPDTNDMGFAGPAPRAIVTFDLQREEALEKSK